MNSGFIYIKKNPVLLLILAASLMVADVKAGPEEQFDKANNLYRSGAYKEAVHSYESLLSGGYHSAELYYNLGNAYYKTGDIAASILNFERARKMDPGDEDIQFNLKLANQNTVDKIEPLPRLFYQQWWDNYVSLFNEDTWAKGGTLLLWVALLFAVLYLFAGTIFLKKAGFFGAAIMLIAGVFLLFTGSVRHSNVSGHKSAIIMETSAYIKSSPDEKSTNLFMLHSGTRIDIVDELKGWKKIRIANGNVGWISDKSVEII